jgi:hypothetical protein
MEDNCFYLSAKKCYICIVLSKKIFTVNYNEVNKLNVINQSKSIYYLIDC